MLGPHPRKASRTGLATSVGSRPRFRPGPKVPKWAGRRGPCRRTPGPDARTRPGSARVAGRVLPDGESGALTVPGGARRERPVSRVRPGENSPLRGSTRGPAGDWATEAGSGHLEIGGAPLPRGCKWGSGAPRRLTRGRPLHGVGASSRGPKIRRRPRHRPSPDRATGRQATPSTRPAGVTPLWRDAPTRRRTHRLPGPGGRSADASQHTPGPERQEGAEPSPPWLPSRAGARCRVLPD